MGRGSKGRKEERGRKKIQKDKQKELEPKVLKHFSYTKLRSIKRMPYPHYK